MKKLAILLSLVMVLGMAVSAAAADVTGYVKYSFTKTDAVEFNESFLAFPDWQVQIKGQVNDALSATVRFDDKAVVTDEDELTSDLVTSNGIEVQRAFFTYNAGVVSTTVGKQWFGGAGSVGSLGSAYTGASAKMPFEGGSVAAVWEPAGEKIALTGNFAPVAGLTVYGDLVMDTAADTKAFTVEGDYDVAGVTVYGEIGKDAAEEDIQNVGATTTVGSFDLTFDYDVVGEAWGLNAETKYNGILFGADLADGEFGGYAKVSF